MSRFKITMTKSGKCDITVTLFSKDNTLLFQRSLTYDIKPTVKEIKEAHKYLKKEGAYLIRITTTPSCMTKTYKL